MEKIFTSAETWLGGFYELAMEFDPRSNELLDRALKAIWAIPSLQGCFSRSDREPSQQTRIPPDLTTLETAGHLFGVATFPNGKKTACGNFLVREETGTDVLGLYVPMGSLARTCDTGAYPFEGNPRSREWREPLENWFAAIGQAVFTKAPFQLGLVGFEGSGTVSARQIALSGVPANRWIGYLYPEKGKLTWHPTNQWQQHHLHAS